MKVGGRNRRRPSRLSILALAGACALVACGRERPAVVQSERFEDLVSPVRSIRLEETEAVVNVSPQVELDPRGGFLVADAGESQVRRYSPDGRLLWYAGRKGGGPGEFKTLAAAVRLPSGEVLAVDRGGQLTVFDSVGAEVVRTVATEVRGVEDAVVLDDSSVLLAGTVGASDGPRLHIWNLARDRVTASFFAPFSNSPNPAAATTAGWSKAALRGDIIAAIFATSDTVYFFTTSGAALGKTPIPSKYFRRVTTEGPKNHSDFGWMGTFDLVSDVHWLPDGTLLIPYVSLNLDQGPMKLTREWHLLRMTRAGEPIFEIPEAPKLLQVGSGREELYFVDPAGETAGEWLVANLRR